MSEGSRKSAVLIVAVLAVFVVMLSSSTPARADEWEKSAPDGFGAGLTTARCSAVYNNNAYVGTNGNGAGCLVWRYDGTSWIQVNTDGFGDPNNECATSMCAFPSSLFVGTLNTVTGGEVWRYDGTSWTQVNTGGFGDPHNRQVSAMTNFSGDLACSTARDSEWGGCEIWRYQLYAGSWSRIGSNGLGDPDNDDAPGLCYSSYLWAGTHNDVDGCSVYECLNAVQGIWSAKAWQGFDDPNNESVSAMSYLGYTLHVGTENSATGTELWSYSSSTGWKKIGADGFGDPANEATFSLRRHGLGDYIGVANASGCQVWRHESGEFTCEASGGFGDPANRDPCTSWVLGNEIYFGTGNETSGCQVWRGSHPMIKKCTPSGIRWGTTRNIYIEGVHTHFVQGQSQAWFSSSYITVNSLTVQDPTHAVINVTADAPPGHASSLSVSINITTGAETPDMLKYAFYLRDIKVTSVVPRGGGRSDTMDLTICTSGASLVQDVSQVTFSPSDGITINSVRVVPSYQLIVSVSISRDAPAVARDVNVITGEEVAEPLADAFTVYAPRITSVSPNVVQQDHGCTVNVTGEYTHFASGQTSVSLSGEGILVTGVHVSDATHLLVYMNVAPIAPLGPRDITVSTAWETPPPLEGALIVEHYSKITGANPAQGLQDSTVDVEITGLNTSFVEGQSVATFSGDGITVNDTTVTDATHATAHITIARDAELGPRDVNVLTPWETPEVLVGGFTVKKYACIVSIDPDEVSQGVPVTVTIAGYRTHFEQGVSTVTIEGGDITVLGIRVLDGTHIEADLDVPLDALVSARDVAVDTGDEHPDPLVKGITVAMARITAVSPDSGALGCTVDVTIFGKHTGFAQGASRAVFSGEGVAVNSTRVESPTRAIANVTIAPDAELTCRDVNVITDRQTPCPLQGVFRVRDPWMSSLEPSRAAHGATLDLVLNGVDTAFRQGRSVVTFSGSGITVNRTSVESGTRMVVNITVDPGADLGVREVSVLTDGEVNPVPDGLTVYDPRILSASPARAAQGGWVTVEVVGGDTNFEQGASELQVSGTGVIVLDTATIDRTHAVANLYIEPGAPVGVREMNVATRWEVPDPLPGGFRVLDGRPVVESVTPPSAAPDETVTVKGRMFGKTRGSSRVCFGGRQSNHYVSWSDTQVKCKVPTDAVTGDLTVTNAVGTGEARRFTVNNTSKGTSVKVSPTDGVTLEFDSVTRSGVSTAERGGDPAVDGYDVVKQTCYRLETTSAFSGRVRVTVSYKGHGGSPPHAQHYVLLHREPDRWAECTIARDDLAGTVTGQVDSLSEFVVAFPRYAATWYLPEGSTAWGFDCYLALENPNDQAVTAQVTFMTPSGSVGIGDVALPPMTQTILNPRDYLGSADFSTKVSCRERLPIAVDRTMTWWAPGAAAPEAHSSVGVNLPAKTWYLPEGSSNWGFECWLMIQNPNDSEARCTVTYMIEGEGPRSVSRAVPPHSRRTYSMGDDIGARDASIEVNSDVPVIPERAMYRNGRREGHDSVGTTLPSTDYYLPEGSTAWGFSTYVLVQNPNEAEATVALMYMTPEGPHSQPEFVMPPNSRRTVRVNDVLPGRDLSTRVHSNLPVTAERAMYWDSGSGEACHDSIGVTSPRTVFFFPDGRSGDGYETWTLVQNPNESAVAVEIYYLTASGGNRVCHAAEVPANSRRTFSMGSFYPRASAATMVRCVTSGKKILVERAMYWNNRATGTDTIGGYAD